jgi:hypothetical protein
MAIGDKAASIEAMVATWRGASPTPAADRDKEQAAVDPERDEERRCGGGV